MGIPAQGPRAWRPATSGPSPSSTEATCAKEKRSPRGTQHAARKQLIARTRVLVSHAAVFPTTSREPCRLEGHKGKLPPRPRSRLWAPRSTLKAPGAASALLAQASWSPPGRPAAWPPGRPADALAGCGMVGSGPEALDAPAGCTGAEKTWFTVRSGAPASGILGRPELPDHVRRFDPVSSKPGCAVNLSNMFCSSCLAADSPQFTTMCTAESPRHDTTPRALQRLQNTPLALPPRPRFARTV